MDPANPTAGSTAGQTSYAPGFSTLEHESTVNSLPVRGEIPEWLSGALVRNGPARFDTHNRALRHWFDGQAMLPNFDFHDGCVSY